MPELPEVETTLRGIIPHLCNNHVTAIVVRQPKLRWPVPTDELRAQLVGQEFTQLYRRAKYLLLECATGTLIIHLGMSGRLRILTSEQPAQKHDHIDITFSNNIILRYTDPRRFGAVLWTTEQISVHPLLSELGVEPLDKNFSGAYLHAQFKNKTMPIKSAIMDQHVVVGVGNIYATEALFIAGISPHAPAKSLSLIQLDRLAKAIKQILQQAIKQGGTTLKDFTASDGKPGYFVNQLRVYGRGGLPCLNCNKKLSACKISQRSTVYCSYCQS